MSATDIALKAQVRALSARLQWTAADAYQSRRRLARDTAAARAAGRKKRQKPAAAGRPALREPNDEVVLRAVRPSAAVAAWYTECLQTLTHEMARSMLLHVRAAWTAADPDIGFAHDESSTVILRRALDKWGRRSIKKFDRASREIAAAFADKSMRDFDGRFRRILRDAGFTVKFKPTPQMVEAYRSVIESQVGLIRSIPQKFLTDVQTSVWSSVMKGSDMAGLEREIKKNYGVSWRRAAFIAADQTAKARATLEEARRSELGIVEAEWVHSGAGRMPRPEHVRWGRQKKRYNIKQGMWSTVDKQYVWPGTRPKCRCVSRSVFKAAA